MIDIVAAQRPIDLHIVLLAGTNRADRPGATAIRGVEEQSVPTTDHTGKVVQEADALQTILGQARHIRVLFPSLSLVKTLHDDTLFVLVVFTDSEYAAAIGPYLRELILLLDLHTLHPCVDLVGVCRRARHITTVSRNAAPTAHVIARRETANLLETAAPGIPQIIGAVLTDVAYDHTFI